MVAWCMDLVTATPPPSPSNPPPPPPPQMYPPLKKLESIESMLRSPVQVLSFGRVGYGSSHPHPTPPHPPTPNPPPPPNVYIPSKNTNKIGVHSPESCSRVQSRFRVTESRSAVYRYKVTDKKRKKY